MFLPLILEPHDRPSRPPGAIVGPAGRIRDYGHGLWSATLIVSLGFLQTPPEMAALLVGVVLLTAVGLLFNRAAGVPLPIWSAGNS